MELHLSDLAAIQLHSCTCKQHRRNSNILQCCSLDLCENSRTRGRHHPMAARSHPRGCAEVTVSRARHRQHAHESGHAGGLDPGPSTREMAAIPLHHVPMEYLRKWAHTPQSISVLVVEYRVPSLLLLCFWCVSCVCVVVAVFLAWRRSGCHVAPQGNPWGSHHHSAQASNIARASAPWEARTQLRKHGVLYAPELQKASNPRVATTWGESCQ